MSLPLLLAAIMPALFLCVLIYFLDKYEKESIFQLVLVYGLGMLCALPAIGIQWIAVKAGVEDSNHILLLLINVFIVVALSEELVKLVAIMIYPYRQSFFNEPIDGIVYMLMIGMGFATVENLIYAKKFGMETTLVRSFTAVPAHAIFAVILGYFVGLSKFTDLPKQSLIGKGLFITVLIHGIYDFFLLQEYFDWLMLFGLVTLVLGVILSWKLIRVHQRRSPFIEEATKREESALVKENQSEPFSVQEEEIVNYEPPPLPPSPDDLSDDSQEGELL